MSRVVSIFSTFMVQFKPDKTEHRDFTVEDRKRFNKNRNSQTNQGAMRQEWEKYQRRQKALGNQIARDIPQRQTAQSPENDAKTTGKGRRKSAKA